MILVLATTWRDELYVQETLEARQLLRGRRVVRGVAGVRSGYNTRRPFGRARRVTSAVCGFAEGSQILGLGRYARRRRPVEWAITAEALEEHFGAHSALESALMAAFDNGRNRIRSVCAKAIDQNGGKGVVLHSGLFRVDGMEPDRGTTG